MLPLLLKALVSAACLFALWFWIEPLEMASRLRDARWAPFAAAALLNLLIQTLNAVKLRAVFPPPRPEVPELAKVNFIAVFFSSFIPGGMGGELARWAYLSRATGSAGRALAAVLLDRITGLWTQVVLALAAWVWIGRGGMSLWAALGAALAALLASVWAGAWGYRRFAAVVSRLGAWYARRRGAKEGREAELPGDIGEALAELMAERRRFLRVAALSLVNHGLVITVFVLLDRTVGGGIGWAEAALFIFCYTFVVLLPVSLGNWGVSEGVLGILYRYAGSEAGTGVLISLLMRAAMLPGVALGWWFFLARRGRALPAPAGARAG